MIQAAGVPGAVRECLIGPAHCSCNTGKNTMLAGSEITRWPDEGGALSAQMCFIVGALSPFQVE